MVLSHPGKCYFVLSLSFSSNSTNVKVKITQKNDRSVFIVKLNSKIPVCTTSLVYYNKFDHGVTKMKVIRNISRIQNKYQIQTNSYAVCDWKNNNNNKKKKCFEVVVGLVDGLANQKIVYHWTIWNIFTMFSSAIKRCRKIIEVYWSSRYGALPKFWSGAIKMTPQYLSEYFLHCFVALHHRFYHNTMNSRKIDLNCLFWCD